MAEGAGEARAGPLTDRVRQRIRAYAAATDNIGVFFGEDIFIAFGSILLIKSTLASNGVEVSPLQLSVWAIPTAGLALMIHGTRLLLFDRWLARQPAATDDPEYGAYALIGVGAVYALTGLMFAGVAVFSARDRSNPKRWRNALFWGLFALSFLAGDRLGDFGNGCLVLVLAAIAAVGGLGRGDPETTTDEARAASAARLGNRLFIPALTIPAATLFGALVLAKVSLGGQPLLDPKQTTPIALGLGVIAGLAAAYLMLRPKPSEPLQEARRLMDQVGWAALLPQSLAALGVVFALTGVGAVIGGLATRWLPLDNRFAVVCAFTVGMALFTIVMGNAFAAFPVMATAVGLPLIVKTFHGDAAVMGAIGMLSGFCGTLATPMAANFNIIPVALLELEDRNAVIKAQAPTAALLLIANTILMYRLVFRK